MTASKDRFLSHTNQCAEAIEIYEFLGRHGYSADFGLRFVWVASISALDHYISELIVEKSVEHFSNGIKLSNKILNETVPFSAVLSMQSAPPAEAAVQFKRIISQTVRFRTFQKADDVADGLAFIWNEDHKWDKISENLDLTNKAARRKLNSIAYRRDLIVHNADYDESSMSLKNCSLDDAREALSFIKQLVEKIDTLVV